MRPVIDDLGLHARVPSGFIVTLMLDDAGRRASRAPAGMFQHGAICSPDRSRSRCVGELADRAAPAARGAAARRGCGLPAAAARLRLSAPAASRVLQQRWRAGRCCGGCAACCVCGGFGGGFGCLRLGLRLLGRLGLGRLRLAGFGRRAAAAAARARLRLARRRRRRGGSGGGGGGGGSAASAARAWRRRRRRLGLRVGFGGSGFGGVRGLGAIVDQLDRRSAARSASGAEQARQPERSARAAMTATMRRRRARGCAASRMRNAFNLRSASRCRASASGGSGHLGDQRDLA